MAILNFIPANNISANYFDQWVQQSGYYAEYNPATGIFSFDEDESLIDTLELNIVKEMYQFNPEISGHFEREW